MTTTVSSPWLAIGDYDPAEPIKTTAVRKFLRHCELPSLYAERGWEHFETPTDEHKAALDAAMEWSRREDAKWLMLCGPTGSGKSHLASCCLRERICRDARFGVGYGFPPKFGAFFSVPAVLLELSHAYKIPFSEGDIEGEIMDEQVKVPLSILDDFGAERPDDRHRERIYQIINQRILDQRPTIITTNLMPKTGQITDMFGDRIASRLAGECVIVKMSLPDWRATHGK